MPDETFDRLARREAQLEDVAARGRRRSLAIMAVLFVPMPVVMLVLNHDMSVAEVMAILLPTSLGSVAYSWRKWHRHPEDAQSIAFVGLDRSSRRAAYRSMRHGSTIDDPVVLTIVESMHDHLCRTFGLIVASIVAAAVMGVALVGSSGARTPAMPIAAAICAIAAVAIVQQRWMIRRAGQVIDRSRARS